MKDMESERREAGSGEIGAEQAAERAVELRCQCCNAPVPGAVCGRKSPCPSCGFPYPIGDCSDLAEN